MIVCIDVGLKRIGLAFSPDGTISLPIDAVMRKNRDQAASEVNAVLREKDAKVLVVGVPIGGSSEDEMRRRIEHFVSLLKFDGKIEFENEYGSSREALEYGIEKITKTKDGRLDSLSAKVILDRWIERQKKQQK